jgi:predicted metal-dependent enzyme (double-stranded beta helix superfamily)
MTYGDKAMEIEKAGYDAVSAQIRREFASVINNLHRLREQTGSPEKKRNYTVAIMHAESAGMWAIKAATWKY